MVTRNEAYPNFMWATGKTSTPEAGRDTILRQVGKGWAGILTRLLDDLDTLGWDREIHQVKEKYGGLRFYPGACSDAVWNRIAAAERESVATCEACGAPGHVRSSGYWLSCRCDSCWRESHEGN